MLKGHRIIKNYSGGIYDGGGLVEGPWVDVGARDCGDESADDAVTMLFAAVGGRCGGARLRRRTCGRCCSHAICSCWG